MFVRAGKLIEFETSTLLIVFNSTFRLCFLVESKPPLNFCKSTSNKESPFLS